MAHAAKVAIKAVGDNIVRAPDRAQGVCGRRDLLVSGIEDLDLHDVEIIR
jgi:DNA-binding protein